MARSRNIKPAFFSNELLAELQAFDRLLFVGLWCLADREGRIEDRPKRIKMELFPCDSYDVDAGLTDLCTAGFVIRYQVGDINVVEIVNFHKHQSPHGSEKDSILPDKDGYLTVNERAKNVVLTGKSKKVHINAPLVNVKPSLENALIPDVLIPDCGILIPEEDQELGAPSALPAADAADTTDPDQPGSPKPKAKRGTRLPVDWSLPAEWAQWAAADRPEFTAADIGRCAESFADYWRAKTRDATKLDWQATWRNWFRNQRAPANNVRQFPGKAKAPDFHSDDTSWADDLGGL